MSGLEIAGIVLGALPLAIEVLDRYGKATKKRIDRFVKIRPEYQEWLRQLRYHRVCYERNLKELLLPLMMDDESEKDKIPELIKDPFGTWWTEPKTARLLEERLQDGYEVYMDCIQVIKQITEEIVDELALGNASVQGHITTPGEATVIACLKALRDSDNRSFQWYRFKLAAKGEEKRTRRFNTLEDYNKKLRNLLEGSDKLRHLSSSTLVTTQSTPSAIDTTLCSFWVTADKFFNVLVSSWNCRCSTHCANLLLRHRSNATPEFEVLFTKEQPAPAEWNSRKTKIVGKQGVNSEPEGVAHNQTRMSLPIHTPSHKDSRPLKSALGNSKKGKGKTAVFSGSQEVTIGSSTMTLVEVKQKDEITIASTGYTTSTTSQQIIHCLCTALETPQVSSEIPDERESSYGYLVSKDITYHIYDVPYYRPTQHHIVLTLQDIIDADLFQNLERRQRFSLALTIASSFVQLLQSPWLPTTIAKTGIIFLLDPNASAQSLPEDEPAFLNEPYVQQAFVGRKSIRLEETVPIADSLDQLGIILLELGFGKRLRDQPCRRRYEDTFAAPNDHVRTLYDVLAARDWQDEVLGEAGQDYAAAVNWCLGGNRGFSGSKSAPDKKSSKPHTRNTAIERWRKDMLNKVVGPLKMCCEYLAGRGVED